MDKENKEKTILSLCSGTGAWEKPYADAGYEVEVVTLPNDVRLYRPPQGIHGILAAPPCTHLSLSGARWWADKGQEALLDALSIVDACLRMVIVTQPRWWVLENPVGRLVHYLGPPRMYFDPCDYGDPWTKKTCLWGNFNVPSKNPVEPTEGSKMHLLPPTENRAIIRSITPPGFAKAFFEANP